MKTFHEPAQAFEFQDDLLSNSANDLRGAGFYLVAEAVDAGHQRGRGGAAEVGTLLGEERSCALPRGGEGRGEAGRASPNHQHVDITQDRDLLGRREIGSHA